MLPAVIDLLPAQAAALFRFGVELRDLAVALHTSQRCLSEAAFDCTFKIFSHFVSERVACSSSVNFGGERVKMGSRLTTQFAIHGVIFLAFLNLAI